ncbi:hypothetical protein [Streptomyces sp. MNP-20]|uniref:hypothetical protein n=1 Tax=Streptomyces sp. MNP-20 TaxID=2721165 RepID=UPI0015577B85|nr:hypothetical protein [Streptomyces sp. MNP-20]
MNRSEPDGDRVLAYPEPPASPLWRRHHIPARPLSAAEKQRNHDLLEIAQRKPYPSTTQKGPRDVHHQP